jgi:uncharacterized protein
MDGKGESTMIEKLSLKQVEAILDALPMEFIFVDDEDRLVYANKGVKRSRPTREDIVGKKIHGCHKPESLPMLKEFITNLKTGKKDEENFWMIKPDRKILNRFLAVRDKSGKYLGTIEYLLDFKAVEELAEAKKDAYKRFYD